jgi:hypothetical protein
MAGEYLAFLAPHFPGAETETNPEKPRRGAFNISVTTSAGGPAVEVWDGRSRGPPRKEKFPEQEELLAAVQAVLPSQE